MSAVTHRPDPALVRSSSYAGAQAWTPHRGLVFTGEPVEVADTAGTPTPVTGR